MRSRRIKALPVVDRHKRIFGIISLADFMRRADMDRRTPSHPRHRSGNRLVGIITQSDFVRALYGTAA